MNLQHLRLNYMSEPLEEKKADANPYGLFTQWMNEAIHAELPEPNAMTLATVNSEGQPSARIVLLKEVNNGGFYFYTNYESQKGQEMLDNPKVALVFFWNELHRQVRIEGVVTRVSEEASRSYFQSRPKGSQIGAWASAQSTVIESREFLDKKMTTIEKEYADADVLPLPPFWGGYEVRPTKIEFWQGRENRLHDRLQYTLTGDNAWQIARLSP